MATKAELEQEIEYLKNELKIMEGKIATEKKNADKNFQAYSQESKRHNQTQTTLYNTQENINKTKNEIAITAFIAVLEHHNIDLKLEHGNFDESDYITFGINGKQLYSGWIIPFATKEYNE